MESIDGFCLSCEHKHRSVSQCSYCDCNWDNTMEDNMIKKIWAKIKAIWNSIVSKFWQD
jgi:hypothetical protein